MSVASLENGNLTLNQLIVNNSQYSEASGFVSSQASFSSSVNSTAFNVPTISAVNSISTPALVLTSSSSTQSPSLSTASNNLTVGTASNAGLFLSSPLGSVALVPTAPDTASIINLKATTSLTTPQINLISSTPTPYPYITTSADDFVVSTSAGSGIVISTTGGSGTLSVNSSNQLLWNGVTIS